MKLNQVLVVYKFSAYQIHEKGFRKPSMEKLFSLDKKKAIFLKKCHDEHICTLESVGKDLKDLGIRHIIMDRNKLKSCLRNYDLIISVGGDGTILRTSHLIDNTPMLGVNSYPSASTGFYCGAKKNNFKTVIKKILDDKIKTKQIQRLEVKINDRLIREPVLNEILFASSMVADTSRYIIEIGKTAEEQRSSGVWISTAAGSNAVIKSAGGKILPILSDKIEYLVREPYVRKSSDKYSLLKGVIPSSQSIKIISEISNGYVYIDGPKIAYHAPMRTEIEIGSSKKPLNIFL